MWARNGYLREIVRDNCSTHHTWSRVHVLKMKYPTICLGEPVNAMAQSPWLRNPDMDTVPGFGIWWRHILWNFLPRHGQPQGVTVSLVHNRAPVVLGSACSSEGGERRPNSSLSRGGVGYWTTIPPLQTTRTNYLVEQSEAALEGISPLGGGKVSIPSMHPPLMRSWPIRRLRRNVQTAENV